MNRLTMGSGLLRWRGSLQSGGSRIEVNLVVIETSKEEKPSGDDGGLSREPKVKSVV